MSAEKPTVAEYAAAAAEYVKLAAAAQAWQGWVAAWSAAVPKVEAAA